MNTNELIITTRIANVEYPDTIPKEIILKNGYQAYYIAPNRLDIVVKDVTYLYTNNARIRKISNLRRIVHGSRAINRLKKPFSNRLFSFI